MSIVTRVVEKANPNDGRAKTAAPALAPPTATAPHADVAHVRPIIWERWGVVIAVLQTAALVITFSVMIYVGIRQLRAYVSVTSKHIGSFDATTSPFARGQLRNCGTTPALRAYTHLNVAVLDYPLPGGSPFQCSLEPLAPRFRFSRVSVCSRK